MFLKNHVSLLQSQLWPWERRALQHLDVSLLQHI